MLAANGVEIEAVAVQPAAARRAIYAVVHRATSRVYVGFTSGTVANRWRQHRYEAFEKGTRRYLCEALRKYGAEAFDVVVLEHGLPVEQLRSREAHYVALLAANVGGCGFNATAGGEVAPSSDPRVRAKIAATQTGRALTLEWRAKVAAGLRGKKKSAEAVANFSAARKGIVMGPEWRAALSASHTGKTHTPETRAKMAASHRARVRDPRGEHDRAERMRALWADPEYRARVGAKISAALSTASYRAARALRVYSDDTRRKLSAAARKRWGG